jgi:hypothetical protein
MRFWNRQQVIQSGAVKPMPGQSTRRLIPGSRRSFDPYVPSEAEAGSSASPNFPIGAMQVPDAEPTDPTRGGVDAVARNTSGVSLPSYTVTNLTTDRTYNANSTSTAELADILGTLIEDVGRALRELDRRLRA